MKVNFKSLILLIVIIAGMILAVSLFSMKEEEKDAFLYNEVVETFNKNSDLIYTIHIDQYNVLHLGLLQVDSVDESGNVKYKVNSKGEYDLKKESFDITSQKTIDFIYDKLHSGELVMLDSFVEDPDYQTPWYLLYLPHLLLGGVMIFFAIMLFRGAGSMGGGGKMNSFSKSRAKVHYNEKDAVKFADVAGADEEKAELEEIVEFLRDPAKFVKLGARIPRGVLLVGPPGTGKTLLAKAVAGEAGVPFFSISGSDFVEMYVGVGASRVRDLFDNARRTPAAIIFIDEIDAVGRHRGSGLGGGHDEREQTLNQLLVEMDGFGTNSGVIVMAATNRPDILDPALLRPGRFDRQINVNYPDMKGREAILRVHCRNKPLEEGVDLAKIAQITIGFTGAELANLMNEAALLAAKRNKALIGMSDIEESYMKQMLGPQKKTRVRTEKDNRLCAYHEAGHAVSAYYCEHADPVKHITIIPAGNTGGVTLTVPTEDRFGLSKNQMLDDIVVSLGGRVAEAIVLDDISTGASGDIKHATKLARSMVTKYGMSDKLGMVLYSTDSTTDGVYFGRSDKDYSESTATVIDDEIRSIVSGCYDRCSAILTEHIDKLHFVAEFLLKNEFMDEEQFRTAMEAENPTIEEIEAIAEERKKKSHEENEEAHRNNRLQEELERERERLAREALEGDIPAEPKESGDDATVEEPVEDSAASDTEATSSDSDEE